MIFSVHSLPVYSSRIVGFRPKNKSFGRLTIKEGTDRQLESLDVCHDLRVYIGTWHWINSCTVNYCLSYVFLYLSLQKCVGFWVFIVGFACFGLCCCCLVVFCLFVLNSDPKLLLLFLHTCIVVHSIFIHRGLSQVETDTTTNIRKPLINSAASIDRRNPLLIRH